ncbi:MAG: twin-arginine translocase TatA/TatE family subunit [Desulfomonilaceae bacterium]
MMQLAMIPAPTELILILVIVIMVFGAKRIPEIMSGLGQGIKTFKKAMEGEDIAETTPPQVTAPPPSVPAQTGAQTTEAPSTPQEKTDRK